MKLNNKGFAVSSIMYLVLIIAIILVSITLAILANSKLILDSKRNDVLKDMYDDILCYSVTESTKTTGNVPQGNFDYGDEYVCELGDGIKNVFFVIENNQSTVSLIMNANIGKNGKAVTSSSNNEYVAWASSSSSNVIIAQNTLLERTSLWTKIKKSQIVLPTRNQLYTASGGKRTGFPMWLHDYMKTSAHSCTSVLGYWTSALVTTDSAYAIDYNGNIISSVITNSSTNGIRPVIILKKSNLN
mgnify:CR=1 FL=1